MWLKNASLYTTPEGALDVSKLPRFLPPGQLEKLSFGFEPPHPDSDELSYSSHGHTLLKFTIEKKVVPGSALKLRVAALAAEFEKESGFAPGKKGRAELKERATDELNGRALSSRKSLGVWLDHKAKRLVIDSTSNPVLDNVVTQLLKTGLGIAHLENWPGNLMRDWLLDDEQLPSEYTIDDAIRLAYPGERGTEVAFKRAELTAQEVKVHASKGAQVASMAMTWDDKVSFVLMPICQLRSIRPLEVLDDRQVENDLDRFENDFVLMTGELSLLIDSLIDNA